MSAFGPKQTCAIAPPTSAFGGKADMAVCGSPLSRSLLGVKRTWTIALHMSADDPKRTRLCRTPSRVLMRVGTMIVLSLRGGNETARVHFLGWRCSGGVAAFCARAAAPRDEARRSALEFCRGQSGRAGPQFGVCASLTAIGLDRWPQRPD